MKFLAACTVVFLAAPGWCQAIGPAQPATTTHTTSVPGGSVTSTSKIVDATPQKVTLASAERIATFNSLAILADGFLAAYLPKVSESGLQDFDEAFRLWQNDRQPQYNNKQVTSLLGAYLGSRMVADFDMEWVVVEDQYGVDYAVRSKRKDMMAFPFASVEKRITNKQHGFMIGVYHVLKKSIATADLKKR